MSFESIAIAQGRSGTASITPRQAATLAVYGIALWAVFAATLHVALPHGILSDGWRLALYALALPVAFPMYELGRRLTGLRRCATLAQFALIAAGALLCDGAAFAWFPSIYSADPQQALAAAGYLLWGVGMCAVAAMIEQGRA